MSKQTRTAQRSIKASPTGKHVRAQVAKEQRRDTVVRATDRVKSSRSVDATKVHHRR